MEISEFEKKRASNLIWNGARNYDISPGFRVYDEDGRADIYWNSIVGAIHLHYNWDLLMAFYQTFQEKINQGIYESLFWLGLENAAYGKEEHVRPVFPYLRREYAKRVVDSIYVGWDEGSVDNRAQWILKGHFKKVLGMDSELPDLVDRKMLEELELSPDLTTQQIIDKLAGIFSTYFTYRLPGQEQAQKKSLHLPDLGSLFSLRGKRVKSREPLGPVRHLVFGYGEHVNEYGSEVLDQSHLSVAFANYTAQSDEGLRDYIENYFGKSIYSKADTRKIEKDNCYGNHRDVKLHITRGEYTPQMLEDHSGYASKMRAQALEQRKKNLAAYDKNSGQYRAAIEKLTGRIRNSILTHLEDQTIRSDSGRIQVARVWRALYLDDDHIFLKDQPGERGNITVDLVLDASTSQIHRTESVSAQGYMIAESLTRCGIPVRIWSFCSLNGYTIVTIYRDYHEVNKNKEIFRYFTSGANRDGLAMRLAGDMLKNNHADHRIVIVLSDCKPNDVIKVKTPDGVFRDYASTLGVEDTASEVHQDRLHSIHMMCVFTGTDDDLPSVRRIYGHGFTRIRSLDMFADAVGNLLQEQIRMMD